jgi:hypothetical protein
MRANVRRSFLFSNIPTFITPNLPTLAKTKIKQGLALTTIVLFTVFTFAQQSTAPPDSPDDSHVVIGNKTTVAVSAGTRMALVLTQPIQTRDLHPGDAIYAQTTSPVASGSEVVIPPGTFIQGKFDKLEHRGGNGELRLQSMTITFADGYVAPVPGPLTLESSNGYTLKDPGKGRIIGTFALPGIGLGVGALIGHSFGHSGAITSIPITMCGIQICLPQTSVTPDTKLKDTAIGSIIGLAAGGIASLVLLSSTHHFFLDAGTPVEIVLQQPVTLDVDQIANANLLSEPDPVPVHSVAALLLHPTPPSGTDTGTCFSPGAPGTPNAGISVASATPHPCP